MLANARRRRRRSCGLAKIDIVEHVTCRSDYGTVLSMLWAPDAVGAQLGMRVCADRNRSSHG